MMKRFLSIAAVLLLAIRPGALLRAQDLVISQGEPTEVEMTAEELADKIIEYAATFLGTPYRYGANGPKRFDCTGYTRYVSYDLRIATAAQQQDVALLEVAEIGNVHLAAVARLIAG